MPRSRVVLDVTELLHTPMKAQTTAEAQITPCWAPPRLIPEAITGPSAQPQSRDRLWQVGHHAKNPRALNTLPGVVPAEPQPRCLGLTLVTVSHGEKLQIFQTGEAAVTGWDVLQGAEEKQFGIAQDFMGDTEGSSCLVAYKKTPPPVPPRTTSKPFISVTVQSSTESAQDTYLDSQDHKSEVTSQSGLSNSSDSLDSTRTPSVTRGSVVTPARDTPELPQKNATLKSDKGTLTSEEPKVENIPKRKLSSIGIQVDCLQPVAKEEPPPPATKFQSIGVQVEDEWRNSHSRSMSSKQDTDSETQEPNNSNCKSSERSLAECPQHNNSVGVDTTTRQPAKPSQIKRNLSYGENNDPALEPSSLPPPDPWLETSTSPSEPTQPGACRRDGFWFLKLLQAETERLEGWCRQMDQETKENNLSEEVLGKVLSAVGSAQLLMSQKFQQFHGLCEQNLNPNANPRPTAQDLAGFWDLLQLSIEDISMKFDELYHLKANSWQLAEIPERKEEKKPPPPVPKKPAKSKSQLNRDKGSDSDKQRQEARKRLMAAKRAASVRQNSATESADSIEIYVPEAQTRL
ncbi:disks large-associated protein 4 [Pitangus sulphuratus]|nr:disks large-associated protein 4 [Pitangus sulphuratus]